MSTDANQPDACALEAQSLSLDQRKFPEYCPTGWELKQLAKAYFRMYVGEELHSFLSGYCSSGAVAYGCLTGVEDIVMHIGEEARQQVIDEVEREFESEHEDNWEAFKKYCKPGAFSKPADLEAIRRLVAGLPNRDWVAIGDFYSPEYARVLREMAEADSQPQGTTPEVTHPPSDM